MKKFVLILTSVVSAGAFASDIVRNEMMLSTNVGVTCVTVNSIQPLQPTANDHILNAPTTQSIAFIRDGTAYFCNVVLK